jgi:hypothetical protein
MMIFEKKSDRVLEEERVLRAASYFGWRLAVVLVLLYWWLV